MIILRTSANSKTWIVCMSVPVECYFSWLWAIFYCFLTNHLFFIVCHMLCVRAIETETKLFSPDKTCSLLCEGTELHWGCVSGSVKVLFCFQVYWGYDLSYVYFRVTPSNDCPSPKWEGCRDSLSAFIAKPQS